MNPLYTKWIFHGEGTTIAGTHDKTEIPETYQMLRDACFENDDDVREPTNKRHVADYENLLEEAELPLYGGSGWTKMSATVALYKFKARHSVSNTGFDELLEMIGGFLPNDHILPNSLYSTKKLLKAFDLGYDKIHACVNDCCLFRKELEQVVQCPKCGSSRWKVDKNTKKLNEGIPAKVLRYFPIIPRFRRMFKNVEIAEQLTWHDTNKSQDVMMRHPVDSLAWKSIDRNWPSFASEPRNLRLGLSSDGFNPFGDFSSRYSCWPVILVTYNLSPSVCMSKENLMLTLLIPGPKQPGNDIDVYLEPLIDDLNELWLNGVSVYDAFRDVTFNLKAVLMWTINDFPAYGNLSSYSTKGKKACPVCGVQTCSKWLVNGKKHAYMDHRRFLPHDHPFRSMAASFDGTEEHRFKPRQLTGSEIYQVVQNIKNDWGKKKKGDNRNMMSVNRKRKKGGLNSYDDGGDDDCDDDGDDPMKLTKRWKKKSIFFELPYWQHLLLRHNLDMMHIEKNICESIIGTLLNMKGKTKDNLNSRKDLKEMGISKKLRQKNDGSSSSKGKTPPYVFLKKEKQIFCKRVFSLRPPDGYSLNIGSRVSLEELKIFNLKSHDCHVLIQQVLSVALRGLLPKGPRVAIFRLCDCLNQLCQRVIDISKVELLEDEIAETLCMLETFKLKGFFQLPIHLSLT
ncbi:uncharacterized protein LOC133740203 isoform X2 [Rosa rugosa]|nr:uncharacterized protein LOC133740203 isoform X2 [Rosa rugosa]